MSTPIVPVVVTIKTPESGDPNRAKERAHRDDLDNRPWRRSLFHDPVPLDDIAGRIHNFPVYNLLSWRRRDNATCQAQTCQCGKTR